MSITIEGITHTDEELANMDPFERQILLESADDAGSGEGGGEGEDQGNEEGGEEGGQSSAPVPAPQAPAAIGKGAEDALQAEAAAAPAPAPAAAPAEAPALLGDIAINVPQPALADLNTLRAAAEAARTAESEAEAKMFDGTMELADYQKLKTAAAEANRAYDKAEMRNEGALERYQERAVEAFGQLFSTAEARLVAAGIPVTPEVREELQSFTASFSKQLTDSGVHDGATLENSRRSLERGLLAVASGRGVLLGKPSAAPALGKPAAAAASKAGTAPDLSKIPPSLSGVPVAGAAEVEGNKFSHIDAIQDYDEQELAIARLSDAEREAYLASAR